MSAMRTLPAGQSVTIRLRVCAACKSSPARNASVPLAFVPPGTAALRKIKEQDREKRFGTGKGMVTRGAARLPP